jgi:hypothetical protein
MSDGAGRGTKGLLGEALLAGLVTLAIAIAATGVRGFSLCDFA